MREGNLKDCNVLLMEDDYFQARDLKEWLESAGAAVVGPTGYVEDLPGLLENQKIDAAILDINLGQGANFAVAYALKAKSVPFMFLTGYDRGIVPEAFSDVPCMLKPATQASVIGGLGSLLATR